MGQAMSQPPFSAQPDLDVSLEHRPDGMTVIVGGDRWDVPWALTSPAEVTAFLVELVADYQDAPPPPEPAALQASEAAPGGFWAGVRRLWPFPRVDS